MPRRTVTDLAAVMLVLSVGGCGKLEPKPASNPFPPQMVTQAEKAVANAKQQDEEHRKFLADLKANPKPVLDFALNQIRKSFANAIGDDKLASAKIEADPKSLKTFGPSKWSVRGSFDGSDKDGNEKKTTWEVEVFVFDGGTDLNAKRTRLEVN